MMSTGRKVHRVQEEHEHERGERDRGHDLAIAVIDVLDLVFHEVERQLDERLPLRWNAGRCLARHEPEEPEGQDADDHRRDQRVPVDRPEAAGFADRLGQEGEVVLDVGRRSQFVFGSHLGLSLVANLRCGSSRGQKTPC
jgi:hypothetical protein